jgi:ATP-dependent Clp protease ATP-binding subunit ClpA
MKGTLAMLASADDHRTHMPAIFLLSGPPGHGKTTAGEKFCASIGLNPERDFLRVSCGNTPSSIELFGASGAYQGAKEGSSLNNFVVEHDGRPGIVVLDEFDKLTTSTYDGFYTTVAEGRWIDKRLIPGTNQTREVDSSRIVWILTTNTFDSDVQRLWSKHQDTFVDYDRYSTLKKRITASFKPLLRDKFGDALARRLDRVLPFVPFETAECRVLVRSKLEDLAQAYAAPEDPESSQLVSGLTMTYTDTVIKHIAAEYHLSEGSSSLLKAIQEHVQGPILDARAEGSLIGRTMEFFLDESNGSEPISDFHFRKVK